MTTLVPAAPATASPQGVVISELRLRGPAGGNDEFVELVNAGTSDVTIGGWKLIGCSTSTTTAPGVRATITAGVTLTPGQHYLLTNNGSAGYSGTVVGDQTYGTGVSDGAGFRLETAAGAYVDAVGGTAAGASTCREGVGISAMPTTNSDANAYERIGGTQDTDVNTADFTGPKASNPESSGGGGGNPIPTVTKIHDIQGSGAATSKSGQTVTIEGVVVGWDDEIGANFERTFPEDAGIFVQEESADADTDPLTSEGIFVGFVRPRTSYPVGTVVRLQGQVKEKFGLTMIAQTINTTPTVVGTATAPAPVDIDPVAAEAQTASQAYYETLEGMNVRLATGVANSGGTNKFGELFLTLGTDLDRVFRNEFEPSLIALADDAGMGDPNNPYKAPRSSTFVEADLFDRVDNAVGPLGYSFGYYKLMPQPNALPTVTDGPTAFPFSLAGSGDNQLRLASFNVENFLPVGAELDLSPVSQEEYDEKLARIVDAIDGRLGRPEIVAVQEVGDLASLQDVAAALGGYTAYLAEGNDSRGIDVGFLVADGVTVDAVTQLGKTAAGSCSDVSGSLFDRPPLRLDATAQGLSFSVITNHFASKSAPDSCREAQAAFVRDQVAAIEAAGGHAIVTGDLNAFEDEGALTTLQDGTTTLTNLWGQAPAGEAYSFQFDGHLQTLDHILVTDGLDARVADFRYAHFDNDYAERVDATDGHHVSDHDPPVVTLSLPVPDTTAPGIEISSPTEGQRILLGATVLADYACTGDDVASCTGTVADGSAVDSSSVGPKTLTVTATDTSGNQATLTRNYLVVWPFTGFAGAKNPPALNKGKAGGTISVKWDLGGYRGLNVLATGSPSSRPIDCTTKQPTGDATPTTGKLTFNASGGKERYVYKWKTDAAWAGTCREFVLSLRDGTTRSLLFTFAAAT